MSINYATGYQSALAQAYKVNQKSILLFERSAQYRWANERTIQIPSLELTGFRDHARGVALGTADDYSNVWEDKTLKHDRSKQIIADPMDIDETNLARSIVNLTATFNLEQKIPELDKYTFSKLYAEYIDKGREPATNDLSEANILNHYDDMMEQMDEAEVPAEGRILYVTPAVDKMLKNAQQMARVIQVGLSQNNISRAVRSLDDVQIIVVPSVRMKSKYDFSLGAVPGVGAYQINMILVHPSCQISARRFSQALLSTPAPLSFGKYVWFEREYWDNFLLNNRLDAIKFNVTTGGQ